MHKRVCAVITCFFIVFVSAAQAMTSTNFQINWDSVNSGGNDTSTSTNYWAQDTLGEQAIGSSSSTNYQIFSAGYRLADPTNTTLSYTVGTQENATQTVYSSFSNAGNTVSVSSTASFSTGDFIGVVENPGASELIAIGKITSIIGSVITVDAWDGNPSALSASPSGGDDFVYRLNGTAAQLGTLTATAVATSLTHTSVLSDVQNGYTVYVSSDGNLRTGATSITNVSDGAVTLGSEEYGARVFGTKATGTGSDFAFSSTTTRAIQTSATFSNDNRIGLIYKASITGSTTAGSYSQLVTYTLTANF